MDDRYALAAVACVCACVVATAIVIKDGLTGFTIAANMVAGLVGLAGYALGRRKENKEIATDYLERGQWRK